MLIRDRFYPRVPVSSDPLTTNLHPDRRPIATRNARWAIAISTWLATRGFSANAISIIGMVACIIGGLALAMTPSAGTAEGAFLRPVSDRWLWFFAALMCQLRLVCNMLDGMVAIARGIASPVGAMYNEIPDRASDIAILVGVGYAIHSSSTLGWLCALLAVMTAYVRAAVKVAGGVAVAQDFSGPMAKPQRMAAVSVLSVFMAVAPREWRGPFQIPMIDHWSVPQATLVLIAVGCVVTIARRIHHGAAALRAQQTGRK